MDAEKKHIIYTAEDIQKYFSGKLSPAEMHALEKAALDDSFLAEAMEGYQGMMEKDTETYLQLLKENFPLGQSTKVITLKTAQRYSIWKVAAAILIIVSGIAITYIFTNKERLPDISMARVESIQDSVSASAAVPGNIDSGAKITPPITNDQPIIAGVKEKPAIDKTLTKRPVIINKKTGEPTLPGGNTAGQINDRNDIALNNPVPADQPAKLQEFETKSNKVNNRKESDTDDLRKSETPGTRKFTATVVGSDGAPLPFANIRIINKDTSTYADAKGHLNLVAPDSLLDIDIKSVGYVSANFTLRSDIPQNKIVLAAKDSPVKGKNVETKRVPGTGKKTMVEPAPGIEINAIPADGWDYYNTYIANNLSISKDIIQKNIHGQVTVTFEVEMDGTVTDARITRSLCDECDVAALRVIKEGPRWKVNNGKRATANVNVIF